MINDTDDTVYDDEMCSTLRAVIAQDIHVRTERVI